MIRIGICDDNMEELEKLKELLKKYSEKNNIKFDIQAFNNGYLFLDSIKGENTFQICFLDIFMPALSGIETARELRLLDKSTHLIFTTLSKEFALDGYSLQATNYLIKPLSRESFFVALNQVLQKINIEKTKNVCVPTSAGFQFVAPDFIAYVEAANNCCTVQLRNKTSISSTISLKQMCQNLSEQVNFLLISRSIILNFDSVIGFDNNSFMLDNGDEVPIPRRKRKELAQKFLDYHME